MVVMAVDMEVMDCQHQSFVEDLFSGDEDKCYAAVLQLKSALVGSTRQKQRLIDQGLLPRLMYLLMAPTSSPDMRRSLVYTLASLAKGADHHCDLLIQCGVVPVLLTGLFSSDVGFVAACLSCLRTLFTHSSQAPIDLLYSSDTHAAIPHLMALMPLSTDNQIAVATILTHACKSKEHQNLLAASGAVSALAKLIMRSPYADVQLPALQALVEMVFENEQVALMVAKENVDGRDLLDGIVLQLGRNRHVELQLAAARCLSFLHRCGVLSHCDPRILYKTLPCLVRLTKKDESVETRILAAETLAYLIEVSEELQRVAAISNHLIHTMASFLCWQPDDATDNAPPTPHPNLSSRTQRHPTTPPPPPQNTNLISHVFSSLSPVPPPLPAAHLSSSSSSQPAATADGGAAACKEELCLSPSPDSPHTHTKGQKYVSVCELSRRLAKESVLVKDMKGAAFRVFASLGANDEDIRKRIMETDQLMDALVKSLDDCGSPKLQKAAIVCLHSLTRSVQLLRTTFHDHPVWKPLMKILSSANSSVDFLDTASSILCNLLLEFSPSKEPIVECGAIELLCKLTRKYEASLRLNGAWGLMNMAFQSDQRIKVQIIATLGSDQIFRLLSDEDVNVVMKTLGLLRNLLSNKSQTDHVMFLYGKQIMQAVVLILESDNVADVKEQAICILANISDGDSARNFIMSNEDVLKKITHYMMHTNTKLQMAAVLAVHNLSLADEAGSAERQAKLRDIGAYKILHQLLATNDTVLFEKVRSALQQFT